MTRRRLWLLTTACCAALAFPTILQLAGLAGSLGTWPSRLRVGLDRVQPQALRIGGSLVDATRTGAHAARIRAVAILQQWLTPDVMSHWRAALPVTLGSTAVVLACGLVAIALIIRRSADRGTRGLAVAYRAVAHRAVAHRAVATVTRLARRGSAVSAIASRTGLAQDAVRQLLRPRTTLNHEPFADLLGASLDDPHPLDRWLSEITMTLRGITTAAHALSYYQRLQEVTANNLANVSTDGFKLDRLTSMTGPGSTSPIPVEQLDLSQGQIHETGRDLDIALTGPGFLTVETAHGDRLTRGGSLHLDVSGRIVDAQGDPVMGTNGPIVLPVGGKIEIRGDGTVLVDKAPVDQFRIDNVSDPGSLTQEGAGQFSTTETTTPVTFGTTTVTQGAIEQPNSDPVLGMVDLVTIQRAYAANLDAIKAMDGVLDTVAGQVGQTQ